MNNELHGKYDFPLFQKFEIHNTTKNKHWVTDILSRADIWANDIGMIY